MLTFGGQFAGGACIFTTNGSRYELGNVKAIHHHAWLPPRSGWTTDSSCGSAGTILTSGENSMDLSVYSADSGKTLSRGSVGFHSSTFAVDTGVDGSAPIIAASETVGKKSGAIVRLFTPRWK